jgi:hypothetical protein
MKVLIDGVVTAERYFASEEELVQGYRAHQAQQGRVVPSFELAALLVAVAVFLAEWAAARTLDELAQLPRRRRERQQRAAREEEQARRDAELDRRLADLERRFGSQVADLRAQQAREVLPEVARSGGKVVLVLESAAEQRLVEQLRAQLPEVEIVVETRDGGGTTATDSHR